MTYSVKVATEEDRVWIEQVAAVNMLVDELGRPELVNPARITELVTKGIEGETCFVVYHDKAPVGVLGAFLIPNMYNPVIVTLVEIFWYVLPEYRGSRAGLLLLRMFEKTARERAQEATLSILTSSSEINIDSLEHKGFRLDEFGFHKRY